MKLKVWALVLIIVGSIALGGIGTFAAMSGFSAVYHFMLNARQAVALQQLPRNWGYKQGTQGDNQQGAPGGNQQAPNDNGQVGQTPSGLPANFNAGVNIEETYATMTNRTVEQVQSAENDAGMNVWGLAQKEGKLDELKQKVQSAVEDSLKKMVTDGKITQAQSDSYLTWVKQYLQAVGQGNASNMPGYGRGNRRGAPMMPWTTAQPGTSSDT